MWGKNIWVGATELMVYFRGHQANGPGMGHWNTKGIQAEDTQISEIKAVGNRCEVVKTSQVFKRAKVGSIISLPNKFDDLTGKSQKRVLGILRRECYVAMQRVMDWCKFGMKIMKYILETPAGAEIRARF